jgi:hypothetical protein
VFGQFLALGETEEHRARVGRAQQRAADDAVGGKLGFLRERQDLRRAGFDERFFVHAINLQPAPATRLDAGQVFNAKTLTLIPRMNANCSAAKERKE